MPSLFGQSRTELNIAVSNHGCERAQTLAKTYTDALGDMDSGEVHLGLNLGVDVKFAADALTAIVQSCPRTGDQCAADCPLANTTELQLLQNKYPAGVEVQFNGNKINATVRQ
jgi:hypothetical protein